MPDLELPNPGDNYCPAGNPSCHCTLLEGGPTRLSWFGADGKRRTRIDPCKRCGGIEHSPLPSTLLQAAVDHRCPNCLSHSPHVVTAGPEGCPHPFHWRPLAIPEIAQELLKAREEIRNLRSKVSQTPPDPPQEDPIRDSRKAVEYRAGNPGAPS